MRRHPEAEVREREKKKAALRNEEWDTDTGKFLCPQPRGASRLSFPRLGCLCESIQKQIAETKLFFFSFATKCVFRDGPFLPKCDVFCFDNSIRIYLNLYLDLTLKSISWRQVSFLQV